MDKHNYVRVGKFKDSNCPYALVNGIVFSSIFDAESYCTREGLDVNTSIRSDDPEVLAECQSIAHATLPVLREIQKHYRREWGIVSEDCSKKALARDVAKANHELGWKVYQDWVLEAAGRSSGFYDCMVLIDGYIGTLEKVLRIKSTPAEYRSQREKCAVIKKESQVEVYAEWLFAGYGLAKCSKCGTTRAYNTPMPRVCPTCGSFMRNESFSFLENQ